MTEWKIGTAALALIAGFAAPALAQTEQAGETPQRAGADATSGDIIVTARKRDESILTVPVAVSALTGEQIQERGVVSIADIARNTPGLNINNNSSGRGDRSFQSFILRGITPGTINLTTTSTFIDGVPVASTTAVETVDDPARVEILKGPQSAYFGRQTFAGAVNVVTREPGNELHGNVRALAGTRDNYDLGASLDGPLFDGLGFTATVRKFSRNGSYRNGANLDQTLGDQSTFSTSLGLVAKPTDGLSIKLLGLYIKDHDGPSADGIVSANNITAPSGQRILTSQSNCTLLGYSSAAGNFTSVTQRPRVNNPSICGRVPKLLPGLPAANTLNDALVQAFLANPVGRIVSPDDGAQGYGLRRGYYHAHAIIDFDLGDSGAVLSSLTGYNNEYFSVVDDLDNFDGRGYPVTPTTRPDGLQTRNYYDFPVLVERTNRDFSQELRVTSGQEESFRWTVGASYLQSRSQNDTLTNFNNIATNAGGKNTTRTIGSFFGLTFDLSEQLTLSVEGRYQADKIATYAGPAQTTVISPDTGAAIPAGGKILERTYKNFMPRAIVQFQARPDLMLYASFARGINPALFNNQIYILPLALQPLAAQAGVSVITRPEKLDNYEIGMKGKLLDGRVVYKFAAYYGKWKDQLTSTSLIVTQGLPVPQIIGGLVNASRTTLKGLELDTSFVPTRYVSIDLSGAVNDTQINQYNLYPITLLTGVTDFRGNELPNTSKWSGNVGARIGMPFSSTSDSEWYVRGDFSYKSGLWTNGANIAKTTPQKVVNVRAGVTFGELNVEAFGTNVFNNRAYTSIADATVLGPTATIANGALNVSLPTLRTFGVRGRYKF